MFEYVSLKNSLLYYFKQPYRTKKYFKNWYKQVELNDWWNSTQQKPATTKMWTEQFKASGLPIELRCLDINRLPDHLKCRNEGRMLPFKYQRETSLDYQRKLFGLYGLKSGIDPKILFEASKIKELDREIRKLVEEDINDYRKNWKLIKSRQVDEINNRQELLKIKMEKLPNEIAKFNARVEKENIHKNQSILRQQQILSLARDKFGYNLDAKDSKFIKFKQDLMDKEKADRKALKKSSV